MFADGIEDFIRKQAQTHDLTITEQLNAGIRFIDFRMMMEYSDPGSPWYSLHMVQSTSPALEYFQDIRNWLDAHPLELLVIFVSKHGNACKTGNDQYPNVTVTQKQYMWERIVELFDGVLVDFSITRLNETSIETMLTRGHRVVFYMADYAEFTKESNYALDQCNDVDNGSNNPGVFKLEEAIPWQQEMYANASDRRSSDTKLQKFYKVSLATGGSTKQIVSAAMLNFLPLKDEDKIVEECAEDFGIPKMSWCPSTLLDIAQLESYYNQISMKKVLEERDWSLPNGIVLNGLDSDGTIRTGTQVLWGGVRNAEDEEHWKTSFGYVDVCVAANLQRSCGIVTKGIAALEFKKSDHESAFDELCMALIEISAKRLALHPYSRWDDAAFGRSATWPV